MPDRGLVPRRVGVTLVVSALICLVYSVILELELGNLLRAAAIVLALNGVVLWRTGRELSPVEEPQRSDWE